VPHATTTCTNHNNTPTDDYPTPIPLTTPPNPNTNNTNNTNNNNKEMNLDSVKRVVSYTPINITPMTTQQHETTNGYSNTTTATLADTDTDTNDNIHPTALVEETDTCWTSSSPAKKDHRNGIGTSDDDYGGGGALLLDHGLRIAIAMSCSLLGRFAVATFIDSQTVALLCLPPTLDNDDDDHPTVVQVMTMTRRMPPLLVSSLSLTISDLLEQRQGTFSIPNHHHNSNDATLKHPASLWLSLHCDSVTKCLAISSIVPSSSSSTSSGYQPFVCIWDWRHNMTGFLLTHNNNTNTNNNTNHNHHNTSAGMSQLTFCHHPSSNGHQLIHTLGNGSTHLQKHMYRLSIVSPSETISKSHTTMEEASSLLMTSKWNQ